MVAAAAAKVNWNHQKAHPAPLADSSEANPVASSAWRRYERKSVLAPGVGAAGDADEWVVAAKGDTTRGHTT